MLHQLIYHSNSTSDITAPVLEGILADSRGYNADHGITGCLLVSKNQYIQLLEGEQEVLQEIFSRIKSDGRNRDVSLIDNKMIERRLFPKSAMVYEVIGEQDFEQIGVGKKSDISFLRNDPVTANKLFQHVKELMESETKRQGLGHNATMGPLA